MFGLYEEPGVAAAHGEWLRFGLVTSGGYSQLQLQVARDVDCLDACQMRGFATDVIRLVLEARPGVGGGIT